MKIKVIGDFQMDYNFILVKEIKLLEWAVVLVGDQRVVHFYINIMGQSGQMKKIIIVIFQI